MEVVIGLHNLKPRHRGGVVTIGSFDGVHQAHQMLLSHVCAKARELGVASTLVTFEPTPREFFKAAVPARLTRFREKITLLRRTELDRLLCLPFNARTSSTPAQWVVDDFLHGLLGAAYVVVGDDFRFGKGRTGDYAMLKEAGDRFGYEVSHLGTLTLGHDRVSSSRVRQVLSEGDLRLAEKLLGHPYFIMGRVVYGRQLGANWACRLPTSACSAIAPPWRGSLPSRWIRVSTAPVKASPTSAFAPPWMARSPCWRSMSLISMRTSTDSSFQ